MKTDVCHIKTGDTVAIMYKTQLICSIHKYTLESTETRSPVPGDYMNLATPRLIA